MRVVITDWTPNRRGVAVAGEIIAIGDVHGPHGTLRAMLEDLAALPRDRGDREIIFSGDLIDRGPAGLACVDAAFGARLLCDRLTVVPGNHELMLAAAVGNLTSLTRPEALRLWLMNGGTAVMDEADPDDVMSPRERLPFGKQSGEGVALPAAAAETVRGVGKAGWCGPQAGGRGHGPPGRRRPARAALAP